jgi:hypothetical protein
MLKYLLVAELGSGIDVDASDIGIPAIIICFWYQSIPVPG